MKKEELILLEKETLVEIILKLMERVTKLEAQICQNSSNSSKPPSSDWKPAKMPRPQNSMSQGGQPGHKGNFMKIEREADETIEINPIVCQKCGMELPKPTTVAVETREKIDVEIRTKVTKYEQYEVICPCCGKKNREEFPSDVKSHISYGEGVQSIGVLLTNHANVSYGKTAEIMNDVFEVPILNMPKIPAIQRIAGIFEHIQVSTGTLVNHVGEFAEKSEPVLDEISENVKQGEIGHFDETSVRVKGKNHWLHTAGNSAATYNTVHAKRGQDGTDANGVLKNFTGVAVHDCWSPYFKYENARHALCNAHLLRELQGVIDNTKQKWAEQMQQLLGEMKKTVDDFKEAGETELPDLMLKLFDDEYERIIKVGEAENPRDTSKRKQSKPRNLLDRFSQYRTEINRFTADFAVPFTNNQAERDIRNAKVKMKVSGGFRSDDGAANFGKVSSVIATAKKQGLSAFKTVSGIFSGSLKSVFVKPLTSD